jgi:hypothetical protein
VGFPINIPINIPINKRVPCSQLVIFDIQFTELSATAEGAWQLLQLIVLQVQFLEVD